MVEPQELAVLLKLIIRDIEEFYVRVEAEHRIDFLERASKAVDTLEITYKKKRELDPELEWFVTSLELARKVLKIRLEKLWSNN